MERDDLVAQISVAADGIETLLRGNFGRWFERVVLEHEPLADKEKSLSADRLYEVLCYLLLVANVRCDGKMVLVATGKNAALPHKPGKKANFAFFRFDHKGRQYDMCNGTAVEAADPEQPAEHPDVSLQEMVGDGSTSGPLLAIWDAKFTTGKRIGKAGLQQMTYWFSALSVPFPCDKDVVSEVCPASFELSAIITNAESSKLNDAVRRKHGFGIVFAFDGSSLDKRASPSRADLLPEL